VVFVNGPGTTGELVEVRVTAALDYDLVGEPTGVVATRR
jgi:hypothetical protein